MNPKDAPASLSRTPGGAHDKTIINEIMLRFRPIAPKPADGAQLSGLSPVNGKTPSLSKRRTKRKYVRVCKSKRFNLNKITASDRVLQQQGEVERISNDLNGVVTLQLLPEKSDLSDSSKKLEDTWCNLDLNLKQPVIDPTATINPQRLVVWVTVECCMEEETSSNRLGFDIAEIELEKDTCPWFVSDGWNNVVWVNDEFKRMAMGRDEGSFDLRVLLGVKEEVWEWVRGSRGLVTCWVKVEYTCHKDKCCMMVPCDAWRLEDGGFAWKLDVEASLRLGQP